MTRCRNCGRAIHRIYDMINYKWEHDDGFVGCSGAPGFATPNEESKEVKKILKAYGYR